MLKMKIATCESLLVCMTRHRKFGIYSACLRCSESFLARMETILNKTFVASCIRHRKIVTQYMLVWMRLSSQELSFNCY